MKTLPLTNAKDDLSGVIRDAESAEVLIPRHGRPAAVVIGFADEDAWLKYRLLNDGKFLATIESARENFRKGNFSRLKGLPKPAYSRRSIYAWTILHSTSSCEEELVGSGS